MTTLVAHGGLNCLLLVLAGHVRPDTPPTAPHGGLLSDKNPRRWLPSPWHPIRPLRQGCSILMTNCFGCVTPATLRRQGEEWRQGVLSWLHLAPACASWSGSKTWKRRPRDREHNCGFLVRTKHCPGIPETVHQTQVGVTKSWKMGCDRVQEASKLGAQIHEKTTAAHVGSQNEAGEKRKSWTTASRTIQPLEVWDSN